MSTVSPSPERLRQLEQEVRRLREENRQAARIRGLWRDAVAQLKQARQSLLETQGQLTEANAELEARVEELDAAKRYVERLAYSDKQVIDNMQEGLIITDADGVIQAVNPAFTAMTGYDPDEVIGQKPSLFKSGRHDDAFFRRLWSSLAENGRWQGEIWNRRKDGGIFPELLSISTIRDWQNDTINYIGVFADITERKRAEKALRASREQLHAVTSLLSEGVLMVEEDDTISFANPEAARLADRPLPELVGRRLQEVIRVVEPRGPYLLPAGVTAGTALGEEGYDDFEDLHLVRPDDTYLPIALTASPILRDGRVAGSVVAFHDVSRRKAVEAQLDKLSRAVEHSPSMVIITDLKGRIEYVNPRFTDITGYRPEQVIGRSTSVLKSGNTPAEIYEDMWETILSGKDWRGEFQNRRNDGELYWQMVSISPIVDSEGNITHFVSVEEDITDRKRAEEKIWHQANFDALTGLPNRRLFQDRLRQALAQAIRGKHHGALLFIDLDRFKYVNDTLGHQTGDELLQQTSRRLTSAVRDSDTVARLGGDEFTVVLPHVASVDDAEKVARKILTTLSQPFRVGSQELFVTGSIGIALVPDDADDVEELLRKADAAMYRSKDRGRDTFSFYTESITRESMRRMALEGELRHALEREELELFYQPILLPDGRFFGVEALLRWHSSNFGEVGPTEFINIAEMAGLMPAIGGWVLRTACAQGQAWRQATGYDLHMSVNLSLAQLRAENFLERLRGILVETGLPPDALELEVTESLVMDDAEYYISLMEQLAAFGVRVALDDFGTGYSSFSYLKRLRATTLKIDQTFVADLPASHDDATIVRSIIHMAHELGMQVTAEGLETPEQAQFLRENGCDRCQGFLHGRPMKAAEFEAWLLVAGC